MKCCLLNLTVTALMNSQPIWLLTEDPSKIVLINISSWIGEGFIRSPHLLEELWAISGCWGSHILQWYRCC